MGSVWLLLPAISLGTAWLYILMLLAPSLEQGSHSHQSTLKFPRSLDEVKELADLLHQYKDVHWLYVLTLFCSAYIYKQSFAIPGSVFMNLLGGTLYGALYAFPLCCLLTGIGASCCFLLAKHCGCEPLFKYFPDRINFLQQKVNENSHSLPAFLLFLRLFPMTPNWFINMVCPILGVPLPLFFITVFIGLMPYNYLCVQTGSMLRELESLEDILTTGNILKLGTLAVIALGQSFFAKRRKFQLVDSQNSL